MKRRVREKHGLKTKSHFFKSLDLQDVTTAEEAGAGAFTGKKAACMVPAAKPQRYYGVCCRRGGQALIWTQAPPSIACAAVGGIMGHPRDVLDMPPSQVTHMGVHTLLKVSSCMLPLFEGRQNHWNLNSSCLAWPCSLGTTVHMAVTYGTWFAVHLRTSGHVCLFKQSFCLACLPM